MKVEESISKKILSSTETKRIQTQLTIFSNMDRRFILLHYTTKEDWWVCVEHINAIRCNHVKEIPMMVDMGIVEENNIKILDV